MALDKGDYLMVAEKVVETLLSDTGSGGLREPDDLVVKTIEPKIRREAKLYSKYELPLIGVEVVRKREEPAPSLRLVDKIFELQLLVLSRGGDREQESERVKKIASRVEFLIREQNCVDKQFLGLSQVIDGSQGVLLTRLKSTEFESRFFEDGNSKNPEVIALVGFELIIPTNGLL